MPTTQEIPATSPIRRALPRVDGPVKGSGKAQYTSTSSFRMLLLPLAIDCSTGTVLECRWKSARCIMAFPLTLPGHPRAAGLDESVTSPGFLVSLACCSFCEVSL